MSGDIEMPNTAGKTDGVTVAVTDHPGKEKTDFLPSHVDRDALTELQEKVLIAYALNPNASDAQIGEMCGASRMTARNVRHAIIEEGHSTVYGNESEDEGTASDSGEFDCEVCGQTFETENARNGHMRAHSGSRGPKLTGQSTISESLDELLGRSGTVSDSIRRFIRVCFEQGDSDDLVLKDDAYDVYAEMCKATGVSPDSSQRFKTVVTQQNVIGVRSAKTRQLHDETRDVRCWRYVSFSDAAKQYMTDRLRTRYFGDIDQDSAGFDCEVCGQTFESVKARSGHMWIHNDSSRERWNSSSIEGRYLIDLAEPTEIDSEDAENDVEEAPTEEDTADVESATEEGAESTTDETQGMPASAGEWFAAGMAVAMASVAIQLQFQIGAVTTQRLAVGAVVLFAALAVTRAYAWYSGGDSR